MGVVRGQLGLLVECEVSPGVSRCLWLSLGGVVVLMAGIGLVLSRYPCTRGGGSCEWRRAGGTTSSHSPVGTSMYSTE